MQHILGHLEVCSKESLIRMNILISLSILIKEMLIFLNEIVDDGEVEDPNTEILIQMPSKLNQTLKLEKRLQKNSVLLISERNVLSLRQN